MPVLSALVPSTSTLTSTGTFTDTQTVTICGVVYTAQTTLTDVAGHFLIGADQTASHLNLLNAINGVANGTTTAAATVPHPLVYASSSDGTHTIIKSKLKGTIGNEFRTSETLTNASWTSTVMAGGTGDFKAELVKIKKFCQLNSELEQSFENFLTTVAAD